VNYIILGVTGFLFIILFDVFALKKWPFIKPLSWFLGSCLLVYTIVMACLSTDKFLLPDWSLWLGWPMLVASAIILINSLFINLPFRQTYIERGSSNLLITTGLYLLVRHPWFYGFFLILVSLILLTGSKLITYALFTWAPLVIVLISIQDKFLFHRMFPGYDNYRKNTPMLIPNRKSIKAFINELRHFQTKPIKHKEV